MFFGTGRKKRKKTKRVLQFDPLWVTAIRNGAFDWCPWVSSKFAARLSRSDSVFSPPFVLFGNRLIDFSPPNIAFPPLEQRIFDESPTSQKTEIYGCLRTMHTVQNNGSCFDLLWDRDKDRSCHNETNSQPGWSRKLLLQKNGCENRNNCNAQLVDRCNLRCIPQAERAEVTNPTCTRRQSWNYQESNCSTRE